MNETSSGCLSIIFGTPLTSEGKHAGIIIMALIIIIAMPQIGQRGVFGSGSGSGLGSGFMRGHMLPALASS